MRILNYKIWAVGLCTVAFLAPVAGAQQPPADGTGQSQSQSPDQSGPSNPIPAYHSPLAGAADNGLPDQNSQDITPDTHSLSGVQALTLGSTVTRTYWQPSFNFSGSADSNPITNQGSGNTWTGWTNVTGEIDVHRVSGNNTLALSYVAGGMIAVDGPGGSGIVQELSVDDGIAFRNWKLSLIEQLSYLPPSGFGVGNFIGTTAGGVGLPPPPLDPGLGTGQTLLTTLGQSLSSSSDVELDRQLTNRTSLTFVGGYSLLRYFDTTVLDYGDVNIRAGYNYQWTRRDTLAVIYTYSGYRYSNFNQSIDSHAAQVSYGRRMTGRLAFQAAAGPQIASFQIPIPAGSTTMTPEGSRTTLYWTANTSLTYQLKRGSLSGNYYHGVGGGSGVLAGSITDTANGAFNRQITRTVSGSLTGGYSRNRGVALGVVPTTTTAQTYDYWSGGGSLNRTWGRALNLNLSYQLQYQTSGVGFCLGVTCGTSYLRNIVSVGVSWRDRPLLF